MRKRYKEKKNPKTLWRPHKKTQSIKWTLKDMISLEEFEYLKKQSIDNNQAIN